MLKMRFRTGAVWFWVGGVLVLLTNAAAFGSDLMWYQTTASAKIDERWSAYFEFQPRWSDGMDRIQTVMERAYLMYGFAPDFRVGAGFLHGPQYLPSARNENRIFEQFDWVPSGEGNWRWSLRTRLEQRYLENVPDAAAWRLREKFGLTWMPLPNAGLYFWDEVFFHLNHPAPAVPAGFDQNRLSIGPRYSHASVTIELGYLLQTVRSQPERITSNPGVMVSLGISLLP